MLTSLVLETIADTSGSGGEEASGLAAFLGFDPSALGLTGFVSVIIISIIRGWLIPAATYRAVIAAKDAEIERLRLTIVALETRGDIQDEAVHQITTAQATTQHLIQEMHIALMHVTNTPIPANYPGLPPTQAINPPGGPA